MEELNNNGVAVSVRGVTLRWSMLLMLFLGVTIGGGGLTAASRFFPQSVNVGENKSVVEALERLERVVEKNNSDRIFGIDRLSAKIEALSTAVTSLSADFKAYKDFHP
jgi:hypothetical protein